MEFNADSFLIEDESSKEDDRNKENVQHVVVLKQTKTTSQQIQKITESTEDICGKRLSKQDKDVFWDNLATGLNNIGPPFHSSAEWRRVWIMHKANKKRKHSDSNQDQHEVSKLNVNVEGTNVKDRGSSELILEKFNQIIVNQTSKLEIIQREVFAGGQRSNSNCETYGPLDIILEKLNQIRDQQVVNQDGSFEKVSSKIDQIIDKQNEIVNPTSETLQREVFAGVQRSNCNCETYFERLDRILEKLNQIIDQQNIVVNQGGSFDDISTKLNQIIDKQNETVQREVFAGGQRSNSNCETYGPLDIILEKLNQIRDQQNEVVNQDGSFEKVSSKIDQIIDKQNEIVNPTSDALQREVFAGVQRSNSNGLLDKILHKLDPMLDKVNKILDQQFENKP